METGQLKSFAFEARKSLMHGVALRMQYWGIDKKGDTTDRPTEVSGGALHRGQVYDDPLLIGKWSKLENDIKRLSFEAVCEKAAYTWFNRLVAIRILEQNSYDAVQLGYGESATHIPMILQRARRGDRKFLKPEDEARLQRIITDYQLDSVAFGILITGYCNTHPLLSKVFGKVEEEASDYTSLLLPTDILSADGLIAQLNDSEVIPDGAYKEVELIGWLYQFYIAEKKDEVFAGFKKNKKAGPNELPAATQIFTPKWIVKYMVENTVGKLWLDLHPESPLRDQMKYLVSPSSQVHEQGEENVENTTGKLNFPEEQPTSEPLIKQAQDIRLLDPAVGSGHILVEGFDLLYAMYLEEFYAKQEAVESILRYNVYGLDIDLRAVQLARFAVLLQAAKRYPDILRDPIMPQIYEMPEPRIIRREDVADFLGGEGSRYVDALYDALQLMQEAKTLGSIMIFDLPDSVRELILVRWRELREKAYKTMQEQLLLNLFSPYLHVLKLMTQQYEAVAANPPYMGGKNMSALLKDYVRLNYPESKSDLFAVFMEVCLNDVRNSGLMAMINQQSWMFLSSYEALRIRILDDHSIMSMLQLGPRTFDEIGGEVVQSTAFVLSKQNTKMIKGIYHRLVEYGSSEEKHHHFLAKTNEYRNISQSNFSKIPGSPIAYWVSERVVVIFEKFQNLGQTIILRKGLATGDNDRFLRLWHEVDIKNLEFEYDRMSPEFSFSKKWYPINKGGAFRKWSGNLEYVINWQRNGAEIRNFKDSSGKLSSRPQNLEYSFLTALTWSKISSGAFAARITQKAMFDDAGAIGYSNDLNELICLLPVLASKLANYFLVVLNPTMNFQIGDVARIPVPDFAQYNIEEYVDKVRIAVSISEQDWNSRETSWGFNISPLVQSSKGLSNSFDKWRSENAIYFFRLHAIEEYLNEFLIKLYDLDINPNINLEEITILQDEIEYDALGNLQRPFQDHLLPIYREVPMQQLISYAIGCIMGRYRLDIPGLHIAHPDPSQDEICTYTYNGRAFAIDDAIIPMMGSMCGFSDDAVHRLKEFFTVVWGPETLTENINFLQECLDTDIETYLTRDFWKNHCSMYKKRPIYWLICSNPKQPHKAGFRILLYMHRMNRFTLEKIRTKYHLPHLRWLEAEIGRMDKEQGTLTRLQLKRLDTLRSHLEECTRWDLVLKDMADRQIAFDLDDGVVENLKLFEGVVGVVK